VRRRFWLLALTVPALLGLVFGLTRVQGSPGGLVPFSVSGSVEGLEPGVPKTISITLRNPNDVSIRVTRVVVRIDEDDDPPSCPSSDNVLLLQATAITAATPIRVPAQGEVVLGAYPRAPRIVLRERPIAADDCRGASFRLVFEGSARS
jgi:hypothetical protein